MTSWKHVQVSFGWIRYNILFFVIKQMWHFIVHQSMDWSVLLAPSYSNIWRRTTTSHPKHKKQMIPKMVFSSGSDNMFIICYSFGERAVFVRGFLCLCWIQKAGNNWQSGCMTGIEHFIGLQTKVSLDPLHHSNAKLSSPVLNFHPTISTPTTHLPMGCSDVCSRVPEPLSSDNWSLADKLWVKIASGGFPQWSFIHSLGVC